MQNINNMPHWGVNPSPLQDTTFNVADARTLPPDDTKNDTILHAGDHTDLLKLGQYINEPGPSYCISHPVLNNAMDSINLACNVHTRATGITYTALRINVHNGCSLFDRGANGVICGDDMRKISLSDRTLNVTGIDDHQMSGLRIGTFGGVVPTQRGEVIAIFQQCAYHPTGRSIISCIQVEDSGIIVDDRANKHGGKQCIYTPDGYVLPLDCIEGLMYLRIRPFTDKEARTLPAVFMTRNIPWDPKRHDKMLSNDEAWKAQQHDVESPIHDGFDLSGNYIPEEADDAATYMELCAHSTRLGPSLLSQTRQNVSFATNLNDTTHEASATSINIEPPNYEADRTFFLNASSDVVRRTHIATTYNYQYVGDVQHIINHFRSPYPALNVPRRHERVCTDTVYSDTAAFCGSAVCAQVFVGRSSRYIAIFAMTHEAQFVNTLNDEIRKRGAMDTLTSDRAQAEISNRVKAVLRSYAIDDTQSEPHQQHQNYAERIYKDVKRNANWVLNWSGAPPQAWLWAYQYCAYIMNRTARKTINWRTPFEALYGQTPDISIMMKFVFWEVCYISNYRQNDNTHFPSESNEIRVRMIGFGEGVGNKMTYKVFNEETQQEFFRSGLRKVRNGADINSRTSPAPPTPPGPSSDSSPSDDNIPQVILSTLDHKKESFEIDPKALIGREFLTTEEDGERHKAEIIDYVGNFEDELEGDKIRREFKARVGKNVFKLLIDFQAICDFVEDATQNEDGSYNMRTILGHRTTGRTNQVIQLLVQWESGECTYEPIRNIYNGDRYLVAEYARDKGLLDEWESPSRKLKEAAGRLDTLVRFSSNVHTIRSNRSQTVWQYGFQVPRNHKEAMRLDRMQQDTQWKNSEELEVSQLDEYKAFIDLGHKDSTMPPEGYTRITLHLVYAVKHDGRHKSRIVAGGHLTGTPTESVYSGVVSLRGVRIVIFLGELNKLKIWQTDIGNAYLEAKTDEKVYVIAGPEFGEREGHIFVIDKALYGLKTSGKRWHERFFDVLTDMDFVPCEAEPDIWMRDRGDHYEYIAVYTDDLTIASNDPEAIIHQLEKVHKFKLKGTAELNFLLGCSYIRDPDGTLCMHPKSYIQKMKDTYVRLFGKNPKQFQSPLEPNEHPELDDSELLEVDDIKIYQCLVGQAQWLTQLGRFDIAVHVMSLSSFRMCPRKGHLEFMKRIYGYLCRFNDGGIRIRTGLPDFSDLETVKVDWSKTPYAGAKEETPHKLPPTRGKPVQLYSYADANLGHNKLNGKAVTGILHLINGTTFDWHCKLQSVVNTATYGSESTAGRTAIEQMRSNKLLLQHLGVRIIGPSILFGDNKTVVNGASLPQAKLHKRHLMLSYHYLREALATGEYVYSFISGKENPSDVLTKHWAHKDVWPMLQALLFWRGDTLDLHKST